MSEIIRIASGINENDQMKMPKLFKTGSLRMVTEAEQCDKNRSFKAEVCKRTSAEGQRPH